MVNVALQMPIRQLGFRADCHPSPFIRDHINTSSEISQNARSTSKTSVVHQSGVRALRANMDFIMKNQSCLFLREN